MTEQAIKCVACGGELEPKAKAAKFKGTMMMTPGAALPDMMPKPAAPAPAPEAPKPPAAPPPAAAAAVPSKVAKATMIGTGGAGLPPPARGGGPLPQAPPPAAGAAPRASIDPALAETTRAPGFGAPVAPAAAQPRPEPQAPAPAPAAAPPAGKAEREDSQRFLVGDPMAAAPAAAPHTHHHEDYDDAQAAVPKQRTGTMIAIAVVGMIVIVAIGYLAASFIGK